MNAPAASGTPAVVLRRTPWRDHDLLVDLLTPEQGRVTAKARGAQRASRRFAGGLEPGARVRAQLQAGRGGLSLNTIDVVRPLKAIRADLDRIQQLSYVLEIVRLAASEGQGDLRLFALVCSYLDHLEARPATLEALCHWELTLLAHLGYALPLDACVRTGRPPDALSLSAGGAVSRQHASAPDAHFIGVAGVATLAGLVAGGTGLTLTGASRGAVRGALSALWAQVLGRPLRTARFLADDGTLAP